MRVRDTGLSVPDRSPLHSEKEYPGAGTASRLAIPLPEKTPVAGYEFGIVPFILIEPLPTGLTSSFKYLAVGADDPPLPPQAWAGWLTESGIDTRGSTAARISRQQLSCNFLRVSFVILIPFVEKRWTNCIDPRYSLLLMPFDAITQMG